MLLGIDVGTSTVAAVLADAQEQVHAAESRRHDADLPALHGSSEQDPGRLLETAAEAVMSLPAALRDRVEAVGVTGQMHGVVILDGDGEPTSPLFTWQDRRCPQDFLDDLRRKSGHAMHQGYGCATLAWLCSRDELAGEAESCCTIQDLLALRLCGGTRPVIDRTDAASWGLFDLDRRDWDREAVEAVGIRPELLPQVMGCGTEAGRLSPAQSRALGLPSGIPVAAAIGDNQASLLYTLEDADTELALTLGTGGQLSAILPAATDTSDFACLDTCALRPYPGRRYALVAASLSGGAAWEWLVDRLRDWMAELGLTSPDRQTLFSRVNEVGMAAEESVDVHPHFRGERHNPDLCGRIEGLRLDGPSIAALADGLARGIVRNLRDMLPPVAFEGRETVAGSGNALRYNPLLQRAASEVLGLPLRMTKGKEEAAAGAALNAAMLD